MASASPGQVRTIDGGLPGAELVRAGLADLDAGRVTVAGELLRSVSHRLARVGIAVEAAAPGDDRLWELVEAEVGPARAHGR
jgi:hypothetical protein